MKASTPRLPHHWKDGWEVLRSLWYNNESKTCPAVYPYWTSTDWILEFYPGLSSTTQDAPMALGLYAVGQAIWCSCSTTVMALSSLQSEGYLHPTWPPRPSLCHSRYIPRDNQCPRLTVSVALTPVIGVNTIDRELHHFRVPSYPTTVFWL